MLSQEQATVIAGAINLLSDKRWSVAQLMAVMGDSRIRDRRSPAQVASCLAYLAMDPATRQPTRALDDGEWWGSALAAPKPTPTPRTISPSDCRECFRPEADHGVDRTLADHEFAPWHSARPTPPPPEFAAIRAELRTPTTEPTEETT